MKQAAAPIRPEIAALIDILADEIVDRIVAGWQEQAPAQPEGMEA